MGPWFLGLDAGLRPGPGEAWPSWASLCLESAGYPGWSSWVCGGGWSSALVLEEDTLPGTKLLLPGSPCPPAVGAGPSAAKLLGSQAPEEGGTGTQEWLLPVQTSHTNEQGPLACARMQESWGEYKWEPPTPCFWLWLVPRLLPSNRAEASSSDVLWAAGTQPACQPLEEGSF